MLIRQKSSAVFIYLFISVLAKNMFMIQELLCVSQNYSASLINNLIEGGEDLPHIHSILLLQKLFFQLLNLILLFEEEIVTCSFQGTYCTNNWV